MKNFDEWNEVKKRVEEKSGRPFRFREGDIWWVNIGENIGVENNGKNKMFLRPVYVIKKLNQYSCLCFPITSSNRVGFGYYCVTFRMRKQTLMFNQIRTLDVKRFVYKIGQVSSQIELAINANFIEFIKNNHRLSAVIQG